MKKRIQQRPVSSPLQHWPDDLHPVLRRIYERRGIRSLEELDHSLARLLPFAQLKGIEQAVALLEQGLRQQWRLLVVGDFDADGATSSALAVKALRLLGAREVDFKVPNRFEYGYGLTPEIVEEIIPLQPDLLITVDNGISSIEGIARARAAGIRVLVTDHHLAGRQLPAADAIVNPNQPGDSFPSKALAGVGVIFYLMLALRARLRESGWFQDREIPNMARLLDLVALGTVADVVPLDHNNRILVAQGLRRIRAGQACPGIQALIEVARRNPQRLTSADLGFALGPRLNAAGRLEDMSIGIRCLLSESLDQAREIARELDRLNQERKAIEQDMQNQALASLEQQHWDESTLPPGLCLWQADWHQGVIGILASRLKDRYHRPVIAFANDGDEQLKGSARSVEGIHIRDLLDRIATANPGLLTKFGGHAMAAGLSIRREDYPRFAELFAQAVRETAPEEALQGVLYTDGELHGDELDLALAELLREQGPWGQGFPEPVFDGQFQVLAHRIVGQNHLKLSLASKAGQPPLDAIAFNAVDGDQPPLVRGQQARLVYKLDVNEFRGQRSLQLILDHLEPVGY